MRRLPFLDRQNLETLETERLWRCEPGAYESVVELVAADGDGAPTFVTRHETNDDPVHYVPDMSGANLIANVGGDFLTLEGELNKLAANISIGRNMAGVHYYSDYYDSLRMGERVAVGILLEQAPTYGDYMETTFKSFDGDFITISGEGGSCPSLAIMDRDGDPVDPRDWWLRHVSGEALVEDF